MNSKDFIGGLLLGAGIGVAIGLATAPGKGNDTLKNLADVFKKTFDKYKGETETTLSHAKSEGKKWLNKGEEVAQDYLKDGELKINELKNQFNNSANI